MALKQYNYKELHVPTYFSDQNVTLSLDTLENLRNFELGNDKIDGMIL